MTEENTNPIRSRGGVGDNPDTPASHSVEVLGRFLTTECDPTRVPDDIGTSLKAACSALPNSISRVLLKAGFQVWFAYFLACQQGTAHALDQLQPSELAIVAGQIAVIRPHPSVVQLISFLFQGARGKTRQGWLASIAAPISTEAPSPDFRPFKRTRNSIHDIATQSQGDPMATTETAHEQQHFVTNTYTDHRDLKTRSSNFFPIYGSIGFEVNLGTQVVWPFASHLGLVFPPYLTSAIAKFDDKAWFKASFPHITQCELELFILATETQHVVKELFDVHLTSEDNQRGILLDNGVFQKIKGSLQLSGSPIQNVQKMLGKEATEAHQLSPSRRKEISQGQTELTRSLILEIWPEMGCPSRLTLRVEVVKLSLITTKLTF